MEIFNLFLIKRESGRLKSTPKNGFAKTKKKTIAVATTTVKRFLIITTKCLMHSNYRRTESSQKLLQT